MSELKKCTSNDHAAAEQLERLKAPILSPSTLLKKVTCTRPMREGCFNISRETIQDKLIIHCYGHGGSGWTTLWGSVKKAIALLKQNREKERAIRIIGSGCMGLAAAAELSRLGYKVAGIRTKELYDIASWRAAGYFALVSIKTDLNNQEDLNWIGAETFQTFRQIEQGRHPYISQEALRYLPVYCSQETDTGLQELEALGLIPPREVVTLDFGDGICHPGFLKFMTYFIDTTKLMDQLSAEVERRAIPLEMGAVDSFEDVEEEIIFNCAGLGAKELTQDEQIIPVRGHLILCNEKAGDQHMDYIIYTTVMQDGKEEYVYLFPKTTMVSSEIPEGISCRGVLGGTFISGVECLSADELFALDQREFKKMLDRHSHFFYGRH